MLPDLLEKVRNDPDVLKDLVAQTGLDECAGPPILAPAFVGPKHVVVIDVMVAFSQIDREDLETTRAPIRQTSTEKSSETLRSGLLRPAARGSV